MARMKRDYDFGNWDTDDIKTLLNQIEKLTGDVNYYVLEGSLIDSYLIDVSGVKFKYGVNRKWFIARENYLNEWSSDLKVFLTDDDRKADAFLDEIEKLEDEKEREEMELEEKQEKKSKKMGFFKKAGAILGVCATLLGSGIAANYQATQAAHPAKIEKITKSIDTTPQTVRSFSKKGFLLKLQAYTKDNKENYVLSTYVHPKGRGHIVVYKKSDKMKNARIWLHTDQKIKSRDNFKRVYMRSYKDMLIKIFTVKDSKDRLTYLVHTYQKKPISYSYGYNVNKNGKTDGITLAAGQDATE